MPLVILGDAAYPSLPWLVKAYPDSAALTLDEKKYNYRCVMIIDDYLIIFCLISGRVGPEWLWRIRLES